MSALPESGQEPLRETMTRLYRAGFALIPLGGPDGKKPLIAGWTGRRIPLDACLKRMANARSRTYGVRLDGMLVIDIDTDNAATSKLFAERFDTSSVRVRTARGLHHYFAHDGLIPSAVRADGVKIDFKAGSHAFVLGPGSVRPDGCQYIPIAGDLAATELPLFRDRQPVQPAAGGKILKGGRNSALWRRAVEYAPVVDDFDGLVADLTALRDLEFEEAASVPDFEIVKVANWAWKLRLEGRLWAGRNSEVRINRYVIDVLLRRADGADALALYSLLIADHGHEPGKTFAIVPDAMVKAGRLRMGRNRLYRARDALIEAGLLKLVKSGWRRKGGQMQRAPNQYRLQSPAVAIAQRERVSSIIFFPDMGQRQAS